MDSTPELAGTSTSTGEGGLEKNIKIPTVKELLKSLSNARHEWKWKSPLQKWCYLYAIGKAAFDLNKLPLFRKDPTKIHWWAYFTFVYAGSDVVIVLYTFYYYLMRGDVYTCLPCTVMFGLTLSTCPLIIGLCSNDRFRIAPLIEFGGKHIYWDKHYDVEYNRICSDHLDALMRRFLTKMIVMFSAIFIAFIGPFYAYFFKGIKTTTIEGKIPFTEPGSDAEFWGNIFFQTVIGSQGAILYVGLEVTMTLFENVVTITPALVKLEMKRVCNDYQRKLISETQMRLRFRNVTQQCLDVEMFVSEISDILYYRTLNTPVCFTYLIAVSIFCQYYMGYFAGYGMAVVSWVQLFYICELGENVQDNGSDDMLYDTEWEVLPTDIQKAIMHLINQKQNVSGISLGPFGYGINRDTFKICTNKVYAFLMFLKDFFQ